MATDFLDEKRSEINARLSELKPLADEYRRLEAAAAALDGISASVAPSARRPQRKPHGAGQRGRPRGGGMRAAQALALVKSSPGATIPEIAEKLGVRPNYLYRVLRELAAEGLVVKAGRGWTAKETA